MKKVESSTVATIHYEPENKCLEVVFKNGGRYHYFGVSQVAYDALEGAESVGKHLNSHIKPHHRIEKK